jgi:integrase
LLRASPPWLQEIITFAVETGLRQEELLSLKWGQIDFGRLALTFLTPKTDTMNTIPLSKAAKKILKHRIWADSKKPVTKKDSDKYVFINSNRNRINARNLIRAFHSAIKKANMQVNISVGGRNSHCIDSAFGDNMAWKKRSLSVTF